MPKATCRCGYNLIFPPDGPDRIVCPNCSAKIRLRRGDASFVDKDGFIRFFCPCGRRLKVKAEGEGDDSGPPAAGKCPDCGRVVPVPTGPPSNPAVPRSHPEALTEELSTDDMAMIEQWAKGHLARSAAPSNASPPLSSPVIKAEAGLRVCPRCGRPVHLGSVACRECGTHVPKR